jgi:hypothetical protein
VRYKCRSSSISVCCTWRIPSRRIAPPTASLCAPGASWVEARGRNRSMATRTHSARTERPSPAGRVPQNDTARDRQLARVTCPRWRDLEHR